MSDILHTEYSLYRDIRERTAGDIYIGVVGAVRTGKSTFIKRFMELMVLPHLQDLHEKERLTDELPQAATGKSVMTTEPKFIPKDAAQIHVADDLDIRVRMIDCVGYMVDGASGYMEDGKERMVKTPWFEQEIPFTQAAELGTQKVIREHATIGILMTTDGSVTELAREAYEPAERRTLEELKKSGKPFLIILNTNKPYGENAKTLAQNMQKQYGATVLPMNCDQLHMEDILRILEEVLYEFPISRLEYYLPKWVDMLELEHPMKQHLFMQARKILDEVTNVRDFRELVLPEADEYIKEIRKETLNLANGIGSIRFDVDERYYYENISKMTGVTVRDEYELIGLVRDLSEKKLEYEKVADALQSVRMRGYGVVTPTLSDINMEEPQLMKHGNKFGVRMKASSPSVHMIRANIETEIAPIVGSEEQAKDLISYIKAGKTEDGGVWNTNIFGKTVGELMEDGIRTKINRMDDECQLKLQDTMQKVVNDNNGGLVCIIL
ncbi:MAG: stage IV sporulation protein A [Eubacterium sp.]|nr:stage IV sporulation protein A [Eubacterium sp.]